MTPERFHTPFRFWMTGSVAVVMAALCYTRLPEAESEIEARRPAALRTSAWGVRETVLRIEVAARDRGLTVLARRDGAEPVIVLGSSAGVTPVVMSGPDSPPDVPFAVHLRADVNGRVVVFVEQAASELPDEVAREIAALPALIDGALSG